MKQKTEKREKNRKLWIFNNHLTGKVPEFHHTYDALMLQNNRLSCNIYFKNGLVAKNPDIYKNIIILQNQFHYFNVKNSSIISDGERYESLMVPQLYTWYLQFFVMFIFVLFIIIYYIKRWNISLFTFRLNKQQEICLDLHNIVLKNLYFVLFIPLLFIYYSGSNWYTCGYWLHKIDIVYFSDQQLLEYIIIMFYIIFIIYCVIFINSLIKQSSTIKYNSTCMNNVPKETRSTCKYILLILCACIVFLIQSTITIFYIWSDYVPEVNYYVFYTIHLITPMCLSLFSGVVVPYFVRRITTKRQSLLILIIRFISCFIIPIVIIIILVPNCFNKWVLFWDPCSHQNQHNFDDLSVLHLKSYAFRDIDVTVVSGIFLIQYFIYI